ncbi:hypothetical protein F8S13_03660 [Chloroflexia bacterium SDU3-3]|nr:hypothetical protein F8S13_03660 [Chloroflexia bacterium SDU3-3]
MKIATRIAALAVLAGALLAPIAMPTASAHGHLKAGDYELVIGFLNEPAYQGEPNGLDLRVTNEKTSQPVKNLEDTLKAELTYGGSKQEFAIHAQWGQDGAYTADVIPTKAGTYTWRIFGTIEGTPVDLSLTSGPETFGNVNAKATVAFPAAEPTSQDLLDQVAQARAIGITGIAVGAIALIAALFVLLRKAPAKAQAAPAKAQGQQA